MAKPVILSEAKNLVDLDQYLFEKILRCAQDDGASLVSSSTVRQFDNQTTLPPTLLYFINVIFRVIISELVVSL